MKALFQTIAFLSTGFAIAGSALVKAMELIRRRLLVWHAEAERA